MIEKNLTQSGDGQTEPATLDTTFYFWAPSGSDLDASVYGFFGTQSIEPLMRDVESEEVLAAQILDYHVSLGTKTDAGEVDDCPLTSFDVFALSPSEMAELIWESLDQQFKIDIGNSTEGQLGAVFYQEAKTEAEAIKKAREWYGSEFEHHNGKLVVYINWDAVTLDDVRREDED